MTANGIVNLEFAKEVIRALYVMPDEEASGTEFSKLGYYKAMKR